MLKDFIQYFFKLKSGNKLIIILACVAVMLSLATYYIITNDANIAHLDLRTVMGIILFDLIVFLTLGVLVTRTFLKNWHYTKGEGTTTSLQHRIILTFSLVAAIPTIIISVFSTYFFNFGLQSWFDQKISKVLDQSIIVAHSYIDEHTLKMKEAAILTADDLNNISFDFIQDHQLFNKTLNAEAEMRSLTEAIVFQRSTNTILAQTALSFSLAFSTIPMHLIELANHGDAVQIPSDPTKIRMLIKLNEYNDTYLLIGRLIDNKIIDHIDQTKGAAEQYYKLRQNISHMQIMFSVIFIFVALLLLLAAISWGAMFASRIISPIRKLVLATEAVQKGNLAIQVSEEKLLHDEIKVLTSAFNRMVRQIDHQQKDLVVAQRAMAWSDVARRVAHEIKNPLTPIQLSAERLLKKFGSEVSDQESFNRYINTIIRHNNDIKTIVMEFVNFARLPSPTFRRCELVAIVKDLVESRKAINDSIQYNFKSTKQVIDFVFDTTQLDQVMLNLLKNAEESFTETELKPQIDVSLETTPTQVAIIVADNGSGFTPELLNTATESYVSNRPKGMGLGLAIVKKIVQDHFGAMSIANRSQGGAIITLTFDILELRAKLSL